jgi:hypothetical protein
MTQTLQSLVDSLIETGAISADDVLALRRLVWPDGTLCKGEAHQLFRLNDAVPTRDAAWEPFFIEAVRETILASSSPRGFVSDVMAAWLIDRVSIDGQVRSACELELLVAILEKAVSVPDMLRDYVLAQLGCAVLDGDQRITATEVALLRRALHGMASQGAHGIGKAEAEFLYDLHDATAQAPQDAAWSDFFVLAIANHLMLHVAYQAPTLAQAQSQEAWLQARGGLFSGLAKLGRALLSGDVALDRSAPTSDARQAATDAAQAICASEAAWLAERLCRDGQLCAAETALLEFLERESPWVADGLREAKARLQIAKAA